MEYYPETPDYYAQWSKDISSLSLCPRDLSTHGTISRKVGFNTCRPREAIPQQKE
jgi:hypothetical protein